MESSSNANGVHEGSYCTSVQVCVCLQSEGSDMKLFITFYYVLLFFRRFNFLEMTSYVFLQV